MKEPKQNKKSYVMEDLKTRVLTVELSPGSPLDEAVLSQQYGLSRTPLREVFHKLAGEGYVNIETNRGATVSPMDFSTMRAFFQSAPMIYAAIARLATELATRSQIDELKRIQQHFSQAVSTGEATGMAMYNHQFHEQMGVMSGSPYLTPSLGRLLIDHTRMSHRFYRIDQSDSKIRVLEACEQHEQMIEAIEQRAPATTVDLTLQHWELSRNEIDKYVLPDPLPIESQNIGAEVI